MIKCRFCSILVMINRILCIIKNVEKDSTKTEQNQIWPTDSIRNKIDEFQCKFEEEEKQIELKIKAILNQK